MRPLSASVSVFLRKDKLCSGLRDEITLLVVNNRLEALADLQKNPSVNSNRFLRLTMISREVH